MSNTSPALPDPECLLRIIESAASVHRRFQFFVWSQGDLQRWLPHKVLVCGAYDRIRHELAFDVFNSVPMTARALESLQSPDAPLIKAAGRIWRERRRQPSRVPLASEEGSHAEAGLRSPLWSEGYRELLVHGLSRPDRPNEVESIFLLGHPGLGHDEQMLQALDLLMPYIHTTYQRVCVTERQMVGEASSVSPPVQTEPEPRPFAITEREREILRWVREGMNNQQISEKLGISALTVKNHIQKILRKLGATNRAQAVAMAMTMNALGGSSSSPGEPS